MRTRSAILLMTLAAPATPAVAQDAPRSTHRVTGRVIKQAEGAGVIVTVLDRDSGLRLPARVIVTDAQGKHSDGSGRGVYSDGRFFVDGQFSAAFPAGSARVEIRCGPNYVSLAIDVDVPRNRWVTIEARMARWFAPEDRGWFSGDNHVHAQHDRHAAVKTDLGYTALQARANGLSYVTEAGSNVSYDEMGKLSTKSFLFRFAPELRPGPFIGHLNSPGIDKPLGDKLKRELFRRPLPQQALADAIHARGGVLIHTHPTTPAHQLHWMGATEVLSDAVLGRLADAMDLDDGNTQRLWFAALNLGNRMTASGSTDAALGRKNTRSPGDRRVYCRAKTLTYPAVVDAIRSGRTFVNNGSPLFPFFTMGEHEIGDTVTVDAERVIRARVELHSLRPLKWARIYGSGNTEKILDVKGRSGKLVIEHDVRPPADRASWYVVRAEAEGGAWAITSPVYFRPTGWKRPGGASALVLQISNASRFAELRKDFFAHIIATVSPGDPIARVELMQGNTTTKAFAPTDGSRTQGEKTPVTGIYGDYAAGWLWHPHVAGPLHFQGDWPIKKTGRYAVRVTLRSGRVIRSDAVDFDASHPNSHQIGVAHLNGLNTELTIHGYGEEAPLANLPQGDHWWYPKKSYRSYTTWFGQRRETITGGDKSAAARFHTSVRGSPARGSAPHTPR